MLEILRGMRDEVDFSHNVHALWDSEPNCEVTAELEKPNELLDHEIQDAKWSCVAKHEKSMMAMKTMKVGDYSPDWTEVLKVAAATKTTPCTFRFVNGNKATVKL